MVWTDASKLFADEDLLVLADIPTATPLQEFTSSMKCSRESEC